MSVELLQSSHEAAQAVKRAMRLDLGRSSESRFEILRATVWGLAAPTSKAHVNRVLSVALPTWRLLSERRTTSEETLRAELRAGLSTLGDAGDLIELSGGFWAPATVRFVELPDGTGYLLIGGAPSVLLQLEQNMIEFQGPHRHFATIPSELAATVRVESLGSWAKLPEASLQGWARDVLESFARHPYSPTIADVFEFYLPDNARPGAPQFKRWSQDAGNRTGTLLARRQRLYGAREYRLVDVRAGRIVAACELHDADVRRLMYALDLAAKNPVRARSFRTGQRTEWLFMSELPRGEQRTFAAFGTLTIPEERPFERRWTFVRNEELALEMLRSLGIVMEQQPREIRR